MDTSQLTPQQQEQIHRPAEDMASRYQVSMAVAQRRIHDWLTPRTKRDDGHKP